MTRTSSDRIEGAPEAADHAPGDVGLYPVPRHLTGHLAPVPDEIDAVDLPFEGALPPELTGLLLRNGPNPLPGLPSRHWLVGHGMVHGIRLDGGHATWYRNRWVRTKALAMKTRGESTFLPAGSWTAPRSRRTPASSPTPGESWR